MKQLSKSTIKSLRFYKIIVTLLLVSFGFNAAFSKSNPNSNKSISGYNSSKALKTDKTNVAWGSGYSDNGSATARVNSLGVADPNNSTITANPTVVLADGTSASTITVQLVDSSFSNLTVSGGTVSITTDNGTISTITDNNDGTYSATLTSLTIATATVAFTIDGVSSPNNATVNFVASLPTVTGIATFTTFSSCASSVSSEQTFTVSGANLLDNLVVTAPTGYEFSLTSVTGFVSSFFLTPTAGTVEPTTIYVRLAANAINGASGDITLTSTGATTVNVPTGIAVVSPLSVAGTITITAPSTVCSVTNSTLLTLEGNTGTIQWQSSTDNSVFSNISDATGQTYTATNLLATTYYKAVVTSGACASATTAVAATITVNPTPVIAAKTATICSGSNFSVTPTNGTDVVPAGTLYTWTFTDNANVTGEADNLGTTFIGESNTNNDNPAWNYGFGYYYDTDFGTWSTTSQDIGQSFTANQSAELNAITVKIPIIDYSGNVTLNVYSGAGKTVNVLSTQTMMVNTTGEKTFTLPNPVNITSGQVYTFILYAAPQMGARITSTADTYSGGSVYTYNGLSGGAGGSDIYFKTHYGTNPAATISGTLTNTSSTNQNVVYSVTPVSTQGCSGTPFNVTVTVNPTSVAGTISGATTVCSGTNSTELTVVGNTGSVQWQSSTDNSNFTDISGATGQTYTPTDLTVATYYQAVVTSGLCASETTPSVVINIDAPSVAGSISEGTTVCSGTNSTELTLSGYTGDIVKWQSSLTSNFSGTVTDIANTTTTYTATNLTTTTYYRAIVQNGVCSSATTSGATIIVSPLPTSLVGSDATICSGDTYTASGTATNGTILWITTGTGTFSDTSIANPVYTPSAEDITAGSVYLSMVVKGIDGCYRLDNSIYAYAGFKLTITTVPVANVNAGPATASICSDAIYTSSGTSTNGTILWTTSGNGSFDDATINTPIYTPSSDDITAGTVTLTMTVSSPAVGSCPANAPVSDTVILSIVAPPTVDAGSSPVDVCAGATYTLAGSATNGSILWTSSGTGTFSNATLAAAIYTPSSDDLSNGFVVLTMTVTGTGGCSYVTDTIQLNFSPAPTSDAGPTTASICSDSTYTTNATASVGSTISWSTSGTGTFANGDSLNAVYTPSSEDITAGSVTLTMNVSGTGICSGVTVSDSLTLSISPVPTSNAGPATASICQGNTYTTSGTAANGTIFWTTTGTGSFSDATTATPVYTPSPADVSLGTVSLTMTVTGSGVCESSTVSDTVILSITAPPTANAGPATAQICNGSTYTLGGTATNGTILWTTSGTGLFSDATIATPVYTPSSADLTLGTVTLTMTVTGGGGCTTASDAIDLRIFTVALATSQINVTCFGLTNGSASVTPSGGTAPYTYLWTSGKGTLYSATNLAAGNYSCTVTDANGCTATNNFTITQPVVLAASTAQTNVTTFGGADGSITVTVSGGTSPYSYVWSPSVGSGATVNDLLVGTYICTVTDANGCSVIKTVTITEPSNFTATTTQTNILCNGASTGSATVSVSGGVSPITYSWSPSGGSGATASNLAAGTYTCTIRDNNGAGLSLTKTVTITQPSALTATTSQTNVLIYGNATGTASVNVSGGNSPYTYSWSPSVGTGASVTGLLAGSYNCTITDANNCSITKTITITQPAVLASTTSQTNVICNGDATGTATMSITGGMTPYAYVWTPSVSTGATASNLVVGTYSCTVTDANGATQTKSFIITQPTAITATTSQINVSCNGTLTGTASVVVTGGISPYTYTWTNSASTAATASSLAAGSYTCTITDANGCVLTKSFIITEPAILSATVSQTNVVVYGESTGIASVNVSGGTSPYTYAWTPSGGTGATAINLAAGSYTCTITDAKGCTLSKIFAINQPGSLTATTSQTNVLCNGFATGAASVNVSGGSLSYSYLWSPSGGTTANASNLVAGNYTCTITDTFGALLVKAFTLTQPAALTATTTQTNVVINGESTGVATVIVSGGTTGYSYSWSPSGGNAATANNLAAGTYTCTITDANSCSISKTFIITEPTALTATTSKTDVLCNGASTGAASVSASGGVLPYIYSWSPLVGTGASVTGLTAGTYVCTITDANGASIDKSITIGQPSALTATQSQTNVSCNAGANGSATVTASGGTSTYSYLWFPSGGTGATASNLVAGAYTCTITDANGCSIVKSFTVTEPSALTATTTQTNVLINGNSTGVATVTAAGGTTGYAYAWSPSGGTAATATGLSAGTYTCTITDANDCAITKTVTITQPTALIASTSQTNVLCNGGSTGIASVIASGAVAPYTYTWTNSLSTSATASNLVAGTYECTITDANNSVITKTIVVTEASALTATTSQTNVSCNAAVNGAASVTVSGGVSLYTYSWYPSGGLGAAINNIAAGTYTCTITDANGCTLTKSFTITQPSVLAATTSQTNILCNGSATGSATVTVTGGTSGYSYLWSPSGGTSDTASDLVAGTYSCVVTDSNGCFITKSFTITQPSALTATTSQTNVSCNASSTGIASVVVSGGVSPYTYLWTNSGGTAATASDLAAGSYACTITDANGCILTKSFTITQPAALSATKSQTDVAIAGGSTGIASVSVSGGTSAYTYSWSPSGGTGATANHLAAGSYTCTITDSKGCQLTELFAIIEPTSLTATTSQTNVLCHGAATGFASVSVLGGTESYNYLWAPTGGSSSSASNLVAGSYTCTITDTNGALLVKAFTISQPSLLTATTTQTNVAINGESTGVATVSVSGGTTGYTYSWSPSGGTAATANNLAAGTYVCTINDANSCLITKTFVITEPTVLALTHSQTDVLCNNASTGAASVSVSGGILPYTYAWSPLVGTGASVTGLVAGAYVCTVTDANGATAGYTFTISEPIALTATQSQVNVSCNTGANGSATVTASGGTSGYTYLWSPSGGTAATASNLVAGAYTCTITDANGCSIQKSFTVTQPAVLTATTAQTNVLINGNSTGVASVNVSGGTTGYTYAWSPSGGTAATATGLAAGTYTCTITDANTCSISKTFTITQPTALIASTSQTNVLCNGASTGIASVIASGAVAPYTYSWTNSLSTSATAINLIAGTYVCTITDANNSIITKTIVVTEASAIPLPISNAGPSSDSICSGSTYTASGTATNGTVLWTTSGSGTFNNTSFENAVYTPSAADIATGSVVLTMTVMANGSCNIPSVSDALVLTIYPTSNAGIIAGATTVCKGINSTVLTLSEYTGNIQWEISTDNVNFSAIPSATSATLTATNLLVTTYYKAVVTSGVCSSAATATATIVVSPTSVAGTIAGAAPVCYGTNSTVLTVSGNVGNIQWQSSTDNITFVAIPSATSSTYTASNLTATTYYRAVSTSGVCSSAIASATIDVNPLPISNAGPSATTICAGTSYATAGVATNGTAYWTTSGTGTFANANNAVTSYTPSNADQINGSVVLTMTVTGSTSGCSLNTAVDAIIVSIGFPSAPVAAVNQNLCYVTNPTVANLDTISGINVSWYFAAVGGTALNLNTPLITGHTYYATQNVSGCESISRTPVLVSLTCNVNAVADLFHLDNGYTGGTTPSVLNNDLLNGSTLSDPSRVILSAVSTPSGFVLNANGTITVSSGTPAGSYELNYQICELADPLNCNQSIATIVVIPPVINAIADNYGPLNGFQGETTASVLVNDLLNGTAVSQNEITLSVISLTSPLVMNTDGTIVVPAGTAPGIYVVKYKISEILNPTNISQVSTIVTVGDCLIFPSNDCDGDGVINGQEIIDGTNPNDSCSMNFAHQTVATTSVWKALDCDGDGVTNAQEILDGTDPIDLCLFVSAHKTLSTSANWNNSDCDGDGVRNGQEIIDATDPSNACSFDPIHIATVTSTNWKNSDCDGDGVINGQELIDGTNPVDICSFNPAHQTLALSTAWNNSDCDGDGVTNAQEIIDATNSTDLCSFVVAHQTLATSVTWNNSDCDGDGVTNGKEIIDATNPKDLCSFIPTHQTLDPSPLWDMSDCDGDGVTNISENVDKTNPLDTCSLVTAHQTLTPSNAWKNSDCDGDGVTNGQEVIDLTNVNDVCNSISAHVTLALSQAFLAGDCDGDGLTNGEEIGQYPTKPNDFDNNGIPDYLEVNKNSVSVDNLEIYNVVTPNGNGENDVFVIRNIELYPNNTVTIFNRWGVVVYEVDSYGQDNKFFKGVSEGRSTMRKLEELPVETYFYTIRYVNSNGVEKLRSGYLYLNK